MFGPDLIKESEEKVKLIRDRLKVAQSRQKSYADSKCKEVSMYVFTIIWRSSIIGIVILKESTKCDQMIFLLIS